MSERLLTSPSVVRDLLQRHGLYLKKRLGQNFLVDSNILEAIVDRADLSPDGLTLEIGPGIGTLTQALAARSALVTAIEYDKTLFSVLDETVVPLGNVRVLHGDAVRALAANSLPSFFTDWSGRAGFTGPVSPPLPAMAGSGQLITCVSNLPYNITSPAIIGLLEQKQHLRSIILMVQEEVAERLVALPGGKNYGAITVFVSYHAVVEILMKVNRNSFYPPPGVGSAVIRLTPVPEGRVPVVSADRLFQVSRALFGQRRKMASNALLNLPDRPARDRVNEALLGVGVAPSIRGEELSLAQMARLADLLPEL